MLLATMLLFSAQLPPGSRIIEQADVSPSRQLVLWMQSPKRVLRHHDAPGCSDWVYGDHWSGPTRLSVIDRPSGREVHRLIVHGTLDRNLPPERAEFQLPFLVPRTSLGYAILEAGREAEEGKPNLLALQDLTGDGDAAEFVLLESWGCGNTGTSVFGYDRRTDRAVQYPLWVERPGAPPALERFIGSVFLQKPLRPGVWDVQWHPGHGVTHIIRFEVTFDSARQRFLVRETHLPDR